MTADEARISSCIKQANLELLASRIAELRKTCNSPFTPRRVMLAELDELAALAKECAHV